MQNTGRLEYAICGEQMATIDDALNMARAGELTITKDAWACVVSGSYPWVEQRRQCYILKNIQQANDDPLLRRIRNEKLFNTSVESNPHYYKYGKALGKALVYCYEIFFVVLTMPTFISFSRIGTSTNQLSIDLFFIPITHFQHSSGQ